MEKNLPYKDMLALYRTKLANERTFLAYFRTAVVFLSSGFAVLKLDSLHQILEVGIGLIVLGPFLLIIGFAPLGGLILNLMPCVLPVISLKILSLVSNSGSSSGSKSSSAKVTLSPAWLMMYSRSALESRMFNVCKTEPIEGTPW